MPALFSFSGHEHRKRGEQSRKILSARSRSGFRTEAGTFGYRIKSESHLPTPMSSVCLNIDTLIMTCLVVSLLRHNYIFWGAKCQQPGLIR